MSDQAVAHHMQLVRVLSRSGGPLSALGATATVLNPAWFNEDGPTAQRQILHAALLAEALGPPAAGAAEASARESAPGSAATPVPPDQATAQAARSVLSSSDQGPRAVVMAGPPGAGKSTVRAQLLGPDTSRWTVIDADAFKDGLIDAALEDQSYARWIKPPQVHALEATGERFFPAEMSALLQAESGLLARQQRQRAVAEGRDIVVDTVLWDARAALELGTTLERAGYVIDVVDVEVSYALSAARIAARWESVYREALAGRDERGGRWVPSEYARIVYGGPGGTRGPSLCESSARELAERCPAVTSYRLFRAVPTPGADHVQALRAPAVLETVMHRARAGDALVPAPPAGTTAAPVGTRPSALQTAPSAIPDHAPTAGTARRAWSSAARQSSPSGAAPTDDVLGQGHTGLSGPAGHGARSPAPSSARVEAQDEQASWRATSPVVSHNHDHNHDQEHDQELEP